MKSNQVVDDLKESFLCAIDAVLGSLDNDTIALDATAREADGDAAEIVANLSQNLATSRHEVTVPNTYSSCPITNSIYLL